MGCKPIVIMGIMTLLIILVSSPFSSNVFVQGKPILKDNRGQATLTVIFSVDCRSTGGTPSDEAVCDKAQEIAPSSAFPNTMDARTPIPSSFVGLSNGTVITLGAGHYLIDTDIDQAQEDLELGLNTEDGVSFDIGASSGDCDNPESGTAQGDIRAGQKQTCIIETTIIVENGTITT